MPLASHFTGAVLWGGVVSTIYEWSLTVGCARSELRRRYK